MKKVLITGSNGQLGSALRREASGFRQMECSYTDVNDLDLTNSEKVQLHFQQNHYDYIVNCAAYTAVDLAESQPQIAFTINSRIPEILAAECLKGTCLIHLSTDYVYDGSRNLPHLEDDVPKPASVYAKSKLAGENVLLNNPLALIIRTSWLYSEFGTNFMKTMIRLSHEKEKISVVYDQTGSPTYAGDLANVIFRIISNSLEDSFKPGIYNYSNEGVCSWYDFAHEIMKTLQSKCQVIPIRSHDFPQAAARPAYSVMDKSKIKRNFDLEIPHWSDSLQAALRNLEIK